MAGVRRATVFALASVVASLGVPSVAGATHGPPPWQSGPHVDSPLEAMAAVALTDTIAFRPVRVRCHSEAEWAATSAELGWDAGHVAGFAWPGSNLAELSPWTCFHLDELWNDGTTEKRCLSTFVRFETTTVRIPVRVRTKVRVRVAGRWRTRVKTVVVLREVQQEVPVLQERLVRCDRFPERTQAVQTLAHEGFHLAGVRDEAEADCYAMQTIGAVAVRLGADLAFAADMQAWMWSWYQTHQGTKPPDYSSPECRADGELDLTPADGRWP